MMSIDTIMDLGREVAEIAAEEGKEPMILTQTDWLMDLDRCQSNRMPERMRLMPNLGDPDMLDEFYPGKWKIVKEFFVDKTGWDIWDRDPRSLSVGRFCEEGLALTQREGNLGWFLALEGEFQTYVYAARRVNDR